MRLLLSLALVIVTGTGGEIVLTHAMKRVGAVREFSPSAILRFLARCVREPWLWASVAMLILSLYGFLAMLSWYPVSFVVPATSLGYVAGPLAAKFLLRERLSFTRWVGIALICLGVTLSWLNYIPAIPGLPWLYRAIFLAAAAPLIFYLCEAWAAWRFFRKKQVGAESAASPHILFTPPVSILKPVRGLDRGAYENFASFCHQDYPEYEILFAAGDENDPAVPVIRRLMRDFPERPIRLLLGVQGLNGNDKVVKLCRLAREARYSYFVISDSDVRVPRDYLRTVVAPLADPQVGAVTSLYRALEAPSFGAAMEALASSASFAGSVLVARAFEGLKFAMGSTVATTRQNLAEIGGFAALRDLHSDDYELGRRIAGRGYRLELAPEPVEMQFRSESLGDYLRHELRWLVGIRHVRPGGHAGLLFTQGLAWAIAAAMLTHSREAAAAWLGAYLAMRLASAYVVGGWGLQDPVLQRKVWLLPLHDFFLFFLWVSSFFVNRIEWRGLEFTLDQGRMIPVVSGRELVSGPEPEPEGS